MKVWGSMVCKKGHWFQYGYRGSRAGPATGEAAERRGRGQSTKDLSLVILQQFSSQVAHTELLGRFKKYHCQVLLPTDVFLIIYALE